MMVDFYKMLTGKTLNELVRPEVQELARRGNVTWDEQAIPMNSYERDHLIPALRDDVFLRYFVHAASQVQGGGPGDYNWAVSSKYAPEAEKRGIGVRMDQVVPYAGLGVSLPIARIAALERVLRVVAAYGGLAVLPEAQMTACREVLGLVQLDELARGLR